MWQLALLAPAMLSVNLCADSVRNRLSGPYFIPPCTTPHYCKMCICRLSFAPPHFFYSSACTPERDSKIINRTGHNNTAACRHVSGNIHICRQPVGLKCPQISTMLHSISSQTLPIRLNYLRLKIRYTTQSPGKMSLGITAR
jgi:hypothetical protein